jgi:hypothetical protein
MKCLPVWREGYRADLPGMALERAATRPCRRLPQPYCVVIRCRRDQLPVWREGYRPDIVGMAVERAATRPCRRYPLLSDLMLEMGSLTSTDYTWQTLMKS